MATPPDFTTGQVLTAAQMNAVGMWLVDDGTLAGTSTNFEQCFTADYRNYRIIISDITMNATGDLYYRMLDNATPASGVADYRWAFRGLNTAGTGTDGSNAGASAGFTGFSQGGANNLRVGGISIDIYAPLEAHRTLVTFNTALYFFNFATANGMSVHNLTTAYNGIQFLTTTATTMTGNVRIYGYNF